MGPVVTGWLTFVGYLFVSGVIARIMMMLFMNRPVCVEHTEGWFAGHCSSHYHEKVNLVDGRPKMAPLRKVADQPVGVAFVALLLGLAWPFTMLLLIVWWSTRTR